MLRRTFLKVLGLAPVVVAVPAAAASILKTPAAAKSYKQVGCSIGNIITKEEIAEFEKEGGYGIMCNAVHPNTLWPGIKKHFGEPQNIAEGEPYWTGPASSNPLLNQKSCDAASLVDRK